MLNGKVFLTHHKLQIYSFPIFFHKKEFNFEEETKIKIDLQSQVSKFICGKKWTKKYVKKVNYFFRYQIYCEGYNKLNKNSSHI